MDPLTLRETIRVVHGRLPLLAWHLERLAEGGVRAEELRPVEAAAIVATRLLTGLAFAGITYSMVLAIGQLLPRALQATGQALYQGTASGIASAGGNMIGGVFYGVLGAPMLFLICAGLCVVGGLIALGTLPGRVIVPIGALEESSGLDPAGYSRPTPWRRR